MKRLIKAEHIVKFYVNGEQKKPVIHDVSIEIMQGDFIAIMGPSGAGKSTLLYALSGMDTIEEGTLIFGDQELSECNEKELAQIRRKKMGFIFQQPAMLKNLNIMDNIIFPGLKKAKNKRLVMERAEVLMKRAGIWELADRNITQVSGGQLQRAGICRALINEPEILFGDEPTGALDSHSTHEIMNLLEEINRAGTTIVLVTHDEKVAARAKKIVYVEDGRIVER